jgi:hypothetical protein
LRRACSSAKCRERYAGPGRHRAVIGIGFELARAPAGDEPLGGQSPTSHSPRRGDGQGIWPAARSVWSVRSAWVRGGLWSGCGSMTSRSPQKSAVRRFCMDFAKSSEGPESFGVLRIRGVRMHPLNTCSRKVIHDSSHRGGLSQPPPFREVPGANYPLSPTPLPSQVGACLVADEPP